MKRIVMAIAATAAVVPAALGLLGNESFAQSLPTAVPASVQLVSSSSSTPAGTADDNGGDRTTRTAEPGDDHGGDRTTRTAEPGDDHGGDRPRTSTSSSTSASSSSTTGSSSSTSS
ncbi:MAG TPA: hypothetical protein PKI27_08575, partial [Dermatophilaceae bacterium]|nr:hypothetical protein [Dermatophilaceae bacterium]